MYQLKINEKFNLSVDRVNDELSVNGDLINADIKHVGGSAYHIISKLKSYNAEVVSFNKEDKTAEIKVDGAIYTVKAKDQFDILLDQMGLSNLNSAKVSELKAPMPGMVLQVLVNEGDTINKGDNLFILEAMKMENIIKAPADVVIKTIKIKPGNKVEKGQVLIQFS